MPQHDIQPQEDQPEEISAEELFGGNPSPLIKYLDAGNIVKEIDDNAKVATDALELYHDAQSSMQPWLKKYKKAINLAKLQAMSGDVEITEKTFPFEGASIAMMPYILEAMLDFSSRASSELVWASEIVKSKIYGKKTPEKEARALRVAQYSNYQLTELIPQWRENQDKLLLILSAPGTAYKKTYYDSSIKEICSDLCLADEVIFNHEYNSFDQAPDKFYVCKYTRNEVISNIRGEQKWQIEEKELEEDKDEFDFIESYIWIDLDDDGLKEPYVALVWEEQNQVVSLYPYFDEETITIDENNVIVSVVALEWFTQYRFMPDPEGGPMGMGWGILLGPMFDGINANVRQLIDAGTLSNTAANSGLISQSLASGRGNAVQGGPVEVVMGQLTPIPNHGSGSLRDNIVQFPFAGPSQVLFNLMEFLISSARSMTNAAINVESSPGEAASLYMAKLQQGLKVPNAIIMRVYECSRKEFKKIALLNYKYADDEKYNNVLDDEQRVSMEEDFNPDDSDIAMASDPSQGSDIERIQRAQVILEEARQQTSQVINVRKAVLNWLKAMKTPDIDELAPEKDPNEVDPTQKMMLAQQQMEAEMKQRDQKLREGELRVKEAKAARESAQTMAELGLLADKQEAEITKLYTDALKNLVDAGIASADRAFEMAQQIEDKFIDAKGGKSGGIPNGGPASRPEAGRPVQANRPRPV